MNSYFTSHQRGDRRFSLQKTKTGWRVWDRQLHKVAASGMEGVMRKRCDQLNAEKEADHG
jgi:hypothetical protein